MKSTKLMAILLVALSPSISPGQTKAPSSNRPGGLVGPVRKMVEQIVLIELDEDDREHESGRLPVRSLWFYRNNKVSREITWTYDETELLQKTVMKYDWKGRLTSSATYAADGTCDHQSTYRYDKQGRRISQRDYSPRDEMGSTTKFQRGKKGTSKQTIDYGPGNLKQAFTCKYEKGRCIERTETIGGRLRGKTKFRYDSAGRIVEEIKYREGELTSRETMRYDAQGHLVEESSFGSDNKLTERQTYKRDPQGRILERARYKEAEKPVERQVFKYDKHGQVTEDRGYNESGELVRQLIFEFTYDKHGNWTRKVCKDAEGEYGEGEDQQRRRTIEYY